MATVQRSNVILQVADDIDTIQHYRNKGYNVINGETGEIIEKAVPHEAAELQMRIFEMQEEINQKDATLQDAYAEISKLKKEISKLKKK